VPPSKGGRRKSASFKRGEKKKCLLQKGGEEKVPPSKGGRRKSAPLILREETGKSPFDKGDLGG